MNIFLYQVPLQLLSIPTVPYVLPDAVRSASGETDIYLPPNLLGTPFFLISPTDTLGQARHLLSLSLQGRKLYRRCCDEVITVLGTGDAKKLKQVVDHAFRQSQKLLDRMPDYSHDPGILKFAYSSLLQPIVSIQSNFRKLWMMSEAGWSDASLQSMVALFLFQEADRRMEFLDRENGYWVDMTRYQLATQLIGWLFHHTDKQFFKDGYFMMRFSAKTEVKEGEADVGGVQYFSPVNIGDC
ncbi:MAG: hypothetical protein Q8P84_09125, partial [Deltaproteobacteria bacterium]|nr:hypothetical protein [Deltaproteobacteria bacterium]